MTNEMWTNIGLVLGGMVVAIPIVLSYLGKIVSKNISTQLERTMTGPTGEDGLRCAIADIRMIKHQLEGDAVERERRQKELDRRLASIDEAVRTQNGRVRELEKRVHTLEVPTT